MKNMMNNISGSGREEEAQRYDPVSLLFKERVIVIAGEVNTQMAYNINAQLQKLAFLDPKAEIEIQINSPGGSVVDGMAIFNTMRNIPCPITTVGIGMQASMGSILLAGGDKRMMTKNSALLVHQIMGGASGGTQHSDFEIEAEFMAKLHEDLKSVYVEFTGLNHKFWDIVGERNSWMSAEDAKAIGFIQEIVEAPAEKRGPYAVDAKRDIAQSGLLRAMNKAADDYIAQMSVDEIKATINSGNAEEGVYSRQRSKLIVRLAQFPQFWTKTLKAEKEAKLAQAAVANDDAKTAAPNAKKGNAPAA